MSMPSARGRKKDKKKFTWGPVLKREVDGAAAPLPPVASGNAGGSLAAASSQGRQAPRSSPPQRSASAPRAAARVGAKGSPTGAAWKWPVVAVAALGGLGACVFLAGILSQAARHHVDGTVMFRQRPLPDAMLCFHAGNAAAPCASAVTGSDGRFSVDMPAGSYKVTVRSVGDADQGIPPAYGQTETTLFNLMVNSDVADTTMLIESK
jgi:hypothetical protein